MEITKHRPSSTSTDSRQKYAYHDINNVIEIKRSSRKVDDRYTQLVYSIFFPTFPVASKSTSAYPPKVCEIEIPFFNKDIAGVTVEALLAVVYDKLTYEQGTELGCKENDIVLDLISEILNTLFLRNTRRINLAMDNKLKEAHPTKSAEPQEEQRVRFAYQTLHIGDKSFASDELNQWKTWSLVERAAKKLMPTITQEELSTIVSTTSSITGSANGRTEFLQAMAQFGITPKT